MHHSPNANATDLCAHACHECQDACLKTIVHCLDLGGEHASREHQTLLADCVGICGLSHDFLHRQSPHAVHVCRECAEICNACADECERLGREDSVMKSCAQTCRHCAESCEKMAGAGI